MKSQINRILGMSTAFLIVFFGTAGNAVASTGLTAEQETNLFSLIVITVASAVVTSILSVRYYWKSKVEDWMIIMQSFSSVSVVTFVCFVASLLPLLRLLPLPDAMFQLYVPSVVFAFLLLATSMWIRTVLNEQFYAYASVDHESIDLEHMRKAARLYLRDRRIARAKRHWARRETARAAMMEREALKQSRKRKTR